MDDLLLEKNADCTQFLKPVEPSAASSCAELPPSTEIVGPAELFCKVHNKRSESEMASQQQTRVSDAGPPEKRFEHRILLISPGKRQEHS